MIIEELGAMVDGCNLFLPALGKTIAFDSQDHLDEWEQYVIEYAPYQIWGATSIRTGESQLALWQRRP